MEPKKKARTVIKASDDFNSSDKGLQVRNGSVCVILIKNASHPWVEKLPSVVSRGWGNESGRVGLSGTGGTVCCVLESDVVDEGVAVVDEGSIDGCAND